MPCLLGLFIFCIQVNVFSQKFYTAENSFAVKLGTTKPLYEFANVAATDTEKLITRKSNKPKMIPNFGGRRQLLSHNPDALPLGADPLFDISHSRMQMNEILPVVNFEGISGASSGSNPPDVNGEIGKDYYLEIVNATFFRVYDKSGTAVSNLISANSIWSQVQQTSSGDPIILYDQEVDRWILTEFPSTNRVLLAISTTSDPLGSWTAYVFQTPRFPDFPKYGIWNDAYYLTTNESGNNFPIYAINREDILAGAPTARIQRLTVPKSGGVFFEVGQPIDWDGLMPPPPGAPGLVVKLNDDDWGNTNFDHIILYKVTIDWINSVSSNIEIVQVPVSPFDTDGCQQENTGGFSCIPQPNGQGIDGAQWIVANKAQYRNFGSHESFVMAFMVDVTGDDVAGIRWIEWRKDTSADWNIFQEGTVGSDDGIHRFMPSIGIDGKGNIGLAYAVSGPEKFPSLRYTGRYSSDPLSTMTFKEYEFATGGGTQGFDRFGDYFAMSVDPADDATFWFVGQYLANSFDWSTRIVAFRATRDTIDVFPLTLVSPENNGVLGEQQVAFSIFNRGLTTVFDFPLGYQFNGGPWIMESSGLDSLVIDEAYDFLFDSTVHFDGPGSFPLRIATLLDNDGNKKNDTLSFVITKYGYRDVALSYSVPTGDAVICANEAESTIRLRNNGLDTITTLSIQILLNNTPVDTILWNGTIAFQEETELSFIVNDLNDGTNSVALTILEINQGQDEIPSNNEIAWTLNAHPDGQKAFLYFRTDNFPQESTWRLFDGNNEVIASGGPYSTQQNIYIQEFCLDPEACYTFTVYDSFGDGMSAQGVQGDFEIFNDEGTIIADLFKPNFGAQSSSQFCMTAECLFDLQIGVQYESSPGAGDALAIVEASNGLGDVMYSIDGGNSFQMSNVFLSLVAGNYSIIAQDGAGCSDTVSFEVKSCNINTFITTSPAVGGDVGQIHVDVTGNIGPVLYSLNGGTFVTDSFFMMLEPGDYMLTVRDSAGCERTDSIFVSTSVSLSFLGDDGFIQISPNPGIGIYQIAASFNHENIFIDYTVFSALSSPLFVGTLVRYDEEYRGELSLAAYPSGIYYVAFDTGEKMVISRVIKLDY